MRKHPPKIRNRARRTDGFSLVEMVIAAALMVIATIGGVAMFNYSITQNQSSRGKQEEQAAISEDLAAIQVANDRYSCSDPDACAVSSSDPGEDSYYAAGAAPSATFNAACLDGTLIDNLITAINAQSAPSAFSPLGISRSVAKTPSSAANYHRYTVTWSKGSTPLRQMTLVPTVAGWCP